MLRRAMKAKQSGFTLVELMFVVVIGAILLSVGVPNFRDFVRNARLSAAANDLITATNLARSEAIKRNRPVSVCSRTSGADTCDGGDFSDGWLVFLDLDGDGAIDGDDEVIERHRALPDSIEQVSVTSPEVDADGDLVGWAASDVSEFTYAPNGFRIAAAGALPVAVAITLCDVRGNAAVSGSGADALSAARSVDISQLGRVQVLREKALVETRGGCPE